MNWNAAALARLEELWADRNLSTVDIGIKLGCNKNQVIGKAHRLKLPARARQPTHPPGVPRPLAPRAPRPSRAKVPPPPPPPKPKRVRKPKPKPPHQPVTILQLDNLMQMCRWPLGGTYDRPPYLYCGKPVAVESYCAEHARISYTGTRAVPKEVSGWTR